MQICELVAVDAVQFLVSHGATVAMLVPQNEETAAMLVSQTYLRESSSILFICNFLFFWLQNMADYVSDHVSENQQ